MRMSRSLGTELWRELIERLDEGVIVFSGHGVVIYANDEAARLLNYRPRDVLGLEKADLVALAQRDRLDAARFAQALAKEQLDNRPGQPFEIVTSTRHLRVVLFNLDLEFGRVTVVLLREVEEWRAKLISRVVMTEMSSPLSLASDYCQTLIERVESGDAYPYELKDLARIIQEGIGYALEQWEKLAWLYRTDPQQSSHWRMEPVDLPSLLSAVIKEDNRRLPLLEIDIPPDLPQVCASAEHLRVALSVLLDGLIAHLKPSERLTITAHNKRRYVQLELIPVRKGPPMQGYILDTLPLVTAEQIIIRHGGRIWLEKTAQGPTAVSVSIPLWQD